MGRPGRRSTSEEPRRIDRQYRVALPKDVREALNADAGDYVLCRIEDDGRVCVYRARITAEGGAGPKG